MADVELKLVDPEDGVTVTLGNLSGGARSELDYTLMLNGAVPDGDRFVVPVLAFRRAAVDIARLLRRLEGEIKIDAAVEGMLRTQFDEIRARQAAETLELMPAADVLEAVAATERFTRELTNEQRENLRRLLALPHGANFSVPGAGKTTALLATYEAMRGRDLVDRLVVVAPKNAFLSWEEEVERCYAETAQPTVARLTGGRRGTASTLQAEPEIVLVTYQLLPNIADLLKTWGRRNRAHVVLDESHRIKAGWSGVYASAALELAGVAQRRDILSGTPLPHSPEDLRPQFDFLWPGQRILPELRILSEAPDDVVEDVGRRVRPLYVRTTKEQLDLPPFELDPVGVELGPLQRELYEVLRSEAARVRAGLRRHDAQFFRALGRQVIRLIQAASNPMLLTQGDLLPQSELEEAPAGVRAWELLRELARYEQPAKVRRSVEIAEESIADGGRVLIWTSFILNVTSLERLLADYNPVTLYGAIPTGSAGELDTREARILRFHGDTECRVMIANPAACGEGVSLHRACHHAIYLDRSFNAAHYLQSVDRIHRLGLPADTLTRITILEARGTIDQRIATRLNAKIDSMRRILNDEGLRALAYDPEDVVEQFEAGIELDDLEEIIDHLESAPGED